MTSRPPADGFATCRRCSADLADGAAFCAECGAPAYQAAANADRRREPAAGRPWWIPVAIVVGGIAAIGGGALLALALGDRSGTAGASATPAVSIAASAAPLASDAPSVEPTPSPSPTPAQAPIIANRSIVEVGPGAVNLREQPSEEANLLAELPPGRRLFVIGDPTDAGDLRWYRVGVVSGPDCPEDCNLIGYVATPVLAEEEAWIAEVAIDCPSSPMTGEQMASMLPLEALHCYGRNEITVTGTVDTPCCIPPNPIRITPNWLAGPAPAFLRFDGNVILPVEFRADPSSELEVPERGDTVEVTGHFEDPAATTCRAEIDEEVSGDDPVQLPSAALVVLNCRATFVWTDYEVTGFEDLGPCCGWGPPRTPTGSLERRF